MALDISIVYSIVISHSDLGWCLRRPKLTLLDEILAPQFLSASDPYFPTPMESTSTVDTDESDPTLPSYKKIESTHEAFLTAFLPSYLAFEQTVLRDAEKGRKQREFKKGSKKDFVNDNITTKLVDEFKLDLVYNLDSVRKVCGTGFLLCCV